MPQSLRRSMGFSECKKDKGRRKIRIITDYE